MTSHTTKRIRQSQARAIRLLRHHGLFLPHLLRQAPCRARDLVTHLINVEQAGLVSVEFPTRAATSLVVLIVCQRGEPCRGFRGRSVVNQGPHLYCLGSINIIRTIRWCWRHTVWTSCSRSLIDPTESENGPNMNCDACGKQHRWLSQR